jgi:eukaryotic-like serine/threonine-protein kinase
MSALSDGARWQRLDAALRELLDLDEQARTRWIDAHCAGDEAIADELRQLLACADRAGPLEQVGKSSVLIDAFDALPGRDVRVGGWTLLRRIGAGGMAEV